jgi:hypothetical protein
MGFYTSPRLRRRLLGRERREALRTPIESRVCIFRWRCIPSTAQNAQLQGDQRKQYTAFEVSKFLDNRNVDEAWTHALPFHFRYIHFRYRRQRTCLAQFFSLHLLSHVRICKFCVFRNYFKGQTNTPSVTIFTFLFAVAWTCSSTLHPVHRCHPGLEGV